MSESPILPLTEGPEGPPGADGADGPVGPPGPAGEGIQLQGDRTVAEMNADDGSTNAPGDAWIMLDAGTITSGLIPLDVLVDDLVGWGAEGSWVNFGQVEGPAGPAGPAGPDGPAGADGADGTPGAAATADVGTTTTLAPGVPATVTNSGTTAAAVFDFGIPEGVAGADGADGPTGPAGEGITLIGDRTVAEMNADDGTTNAAGDSWIMLDAGEITSGTQPVTVIVGDLVSWSADGHWINQGQSQGPEGPAGPTGPDGADGNTIWNGTGAPLDALGVDGDFYIATDVNQIFGPKAAGVWPITGVPLVGPQGADGADGADGDPGAEGPAGPDGADGAPGPTAISTDAGNQLTLGADTLTLMLGALLSTTATDAEVVTALPGTPVATTLYFVTG